MTALRLAALALAYAFALMAYDLAPGPEQDTGDSPGVAQLVETWEYEAQRWPEDD